MIPTRHGHSVASMKVRLRTARPSLPRGPLEAILIVGLYLGSELSRGLASGGSHGCAGARADGRAHRAAPARLLRRRGPARRPPRLRSADCARLRLRVAAHGRDSCAARVGLPAASARLSVAAQHTRRRKRARGGRLLGVPDRPAPLGGSRHRRHRQWRDLDQPHPTSRRRSTTRTPRFRACTSASRCSSA